jgi:hypothetical protein
MSFQLTIAEGKEAGKEFTFDKDSAVIGRTSECDVILYDQGISRRHCRVFFENGRYHVEDLGSSNGTKRNGTVVTREALVDGDTLGVGAVVFNFKVLQLSIPTLEEEPATAADEGSTRIVSMDALRQRRAQNKGEALVPEGAGEAELEAARRSATHAMPKLPARTGSRSALAPPTGGPPLLSPVDPSATMPPRRASGDALARSPSPPALAPAAGASPVPAPQAAGLTAAERARIRRQSSGPVAQFKLFWMESRPGVRRGVVAGSLLVVFSVLGLVSWLALSGQTQSSRGPEPEVLGSKMLKDSFGLGPGVTWEQSDAKAFRWEYTAATRAMAILHFQAQGISEGEVVVTVNGRDVGKVPADVANAQDRSLEVVVPAQFLKKGEPNLIVFDNTKNPPGDDPWRIWNLRLEKVLLPEIPPEQLMQEARVAYALGRRNMDTAMVGARNQYEAWKAFRKAWLLLEAHPEPRPDLYFEARERMKESQRELDRICAKLLLEVESYVHLKNWQAASATLNHVREYFPDETDQVCAWKAEVRRYELGL